jgi:hypothetical protein
MQQKSCFSLRCCSPSLHLNGCVYQEGAGDGTSTLTPLLAAAAAAAACQVRRVGMNSHLVEVSGTLLVYPRRTILVPASLLLPESIPVRSTVSIGVNGDLDSGMVRGVWLLRKGPFLHCPVRGVADSATSYVCVVV